MPALAQSRLDRIDGALIAGRTARSAGTTDSYRHTESGRGESALISQARMGSHRCFAMDSVIKMREDASRVRLGWLYG
jgi:hypothetical protein